MEMTFAMIKPNAVKSGGKLAEDLMKKIESEE